MPVIEKFLRRFLRRKPAGGLFNLAVSGGEVSHLESG